MVIVLNKEIEFKTKGGIQDVCESCDVISEGNVKVCMWFVGGGGVGTTMYRMLTPVDNQNPTNEEEVGDNRGSSVDSSIPVYHDFGILETT